jgi:hypothetical protein
MMKEMRGVCFLFSETGTEGGWWATQEDGFVTEGENEGEQWSYEGLRILGEGDDFTVYGDDDSVLFHGIIHRDNKTGAVSRRKGNAVTRISRKQQVVGGMWVHWIQKGMDSEAWGELFIGEKRCLVRRRWKTERK